MSVTPRGMSIQEAYREYTDGNFIVNRQYQRKLVWTTEEKRKLIDSILQGYPIPLILLATTINEDGIKSFEIIDGMQRLNAVFSYIENNFHIDGKYFNVEQLARAKQLAERGEIQAKRNTEELLDDHSCARLLEYTFAVTEFPAVDPNAVNEVFGRINAYGRQLSAQEKRQAGIISPFANFVREVAAELRGDASSNFLNLSAMPQISVDINGDDLEYGGSC
ncbi:GmrSD restriction endonuclease domain-containing protein [Azotobacter armeniacus]